MKLKRLLVFTLSMTMMVSMVPALAFADETGSETTETTVVETTEPEEKETVKATTRETTKETEKPTETEDKKPEETEAAKPSETEETKPSESEETQPSETKEDEIVETEKGKSVSKKPKAASTLPEIKINLSADGKLSWEPVEGADDVSLYIRWDDGNAISVLMGNDDNPFDLKAFIDMTVVDPTSMSSKSAQSDKHYCQLSAYPSHGQSAKARTEFVYNYKSPEQQITIGTVSNVRISPEGIIEWDPYAGADEYTVSIDGHMEIIKATNYDLNKQIDYLKKNNPDFEVKGSYEIEVNARMKLYLASVTIAKWSGRYPEATNSLTVTPKTAKVKYKKLRKKKQTVVRAKVMNVSNAQGKVTYKLAGVKRGKSKKYKKYFKINAATGNVTIKKKLKKGTYKITCVVSAAGNNDGKTVTKTVTFTIKVK